MSICIAVCGHGTHAMVAVVLKPVASKNLLPLNTGIVQYQGYHTLHSSALPRYPFINQPVYDEKLGRLVTDYLNYANHYTIGAVKSEELAQNYKITM